MVDTVYAHTSKKLSKESMDEFKECFGKGIILQKASYNQDGQCSELEYGCDHPFLDEFRRCLKTWLNDQDFPFRYFMVTETIFLLTNEKLSQSQINEFEKEFEVRCCKYSKECNSTNLKYEFKS